MATLTELEGRLEALKKARDSGVQSLSYNGNRTEFRSMKEMDRAIAALKREIEQAKGGRIVRQIRIYQDGKGL